MASDTAIKKIETQAPDGGENTGTAGVSDVAAQDAAAQDVAAGDIIVPGPRPGPPPKSKKRKKASAEKHKSEPTLVSGTQPEALVEPDARAKPDARPKTKPGAKPGPRTGIGGTATNAGASKRRRFSSLTLRIFAPNLVALAVLVGGVFYLDQYRNSLLDAKLESLETQAGLIAAALSESAVTGPAENRVIDPYRSVKIIERVAERARARARLFNTDSVLIADSRELVAAGRVVELQPLSSPQQSGFLSELFEQFYNWVLPQIPGSGDYPAYQEKWAQSAKDYSETQVALGGTVKGAVRTAAAGGLVISVAVPVQDLRQVVGVLLLSSGSDDIENRVRQARTAVLQAFSVALAITFLLSVFLARTIERPLHRLAEAAHRVRRWRGQRMQIPDLTTRRDEIGELSGALREMTGELYSRLDAIEAFAADVAHEIKNPLSSLRSAMESLPVADTDDKRGRLIDIMQHDIRRLDRLISDISNASRLDSELVREEKEQVELDRLLATAIDLHQGQVEDGSLKFTLQCDEPGLQVSGVASRLGQVIDNLISNARSFSPENGVIALQLYRDGGDGVILVEDEGPGVPPESREAIFDRFYSKRPKQEAFGQHSGLGLSIVRQIIDAHGGTIHCENRLRQPGEPQQNEPQLSEPQPGRAQPGQAQAGQVGGAHFVIRLPLLGE